MNPAPRLLVIDPTPIGSLCATGQFKRMLFRDWPRDRILELTASPGSGAAVLRRDLEHPDPERSAEETLDLIRAFAPEVIYLRPEPAEFRHMDLALAAIDALSQPAMLHIMDDWVAGDAASGAASRDAMVRIAARMAARASLRFTDGPAYVTDFEARLGAPFESLLNGVDLDIWATPAPDRDPARPFTLTHMGNYDPVMSRQAIVDIARAVEGLGADVSVRFEVHVRDYLVATARKDLSRFRRTRVLPQRDDFNAYVDTLRRSDVNVYAYNQDARSVQYMGKGIPNKTCELLAAGKPILAYGPAAFAGVDYLKDHGAARVVRERGGLAAAIRDLHDSPGKAASLVANAAALARDRHDAARIRSLFLAAARKLADGHDRPAPPTAAADVMRDWRDVLRPAMVDRKLRRARGQKLKAAFGALPHLIAHAILHLRTRPLAGATVIILAACLAVTSGMRHSILAGMALAGLAWMASQAAVRLVEVFAERVLNPEGRALRVIRRASHAYGRATWTFPVVLACGALGGRLGWGQGWSGFVGAGVLATLLVLLGTVAWESSRVGRATPESAGA